MSAHIRINHDDDPAAIVEKFRRALVGFCLVVDETSEDGADFVAVQISVDPALTKAAQDKAFAEYDAKDDQARKLAREAAIGRGKIVDAPPAVGQEWTSFKNGAMGGDWIFTVEEVRDNEVDGYWNRSDDVCTCPSDTLDKWPPVDPAGNIMILEAP